MRGEGSWLRTVSSDGEFIFAVMNILVPAYYFLRQSETEFLGLGPQVCPLYQPRMLDNRTKHWWNGNGQGKPKY
jgi:hypothetical protein